MPIVSGERTVKMQLVGRWGRDRQKLTHYPLRAARIRARNATQSRPAGHAVAALNALASTAKLSHTARIS